MRRKAILATWGTQPKGLMILCLHKRIIYQKRGSNEKLFLVQCWSPSKLDMKMSIRQVHTFTGSNWHGSCLDRLLHYHKKFSVLNWWGKNYENMSATKTGSRNKNLPKEVKKKQPNCFIIIRYNILVPTFTFFHSFDFVKKCRK